MSRRSAYRQATGYPRHALARYQAKVMASTPDLYLPMQEDAGAVAADVSGNAHDATIPTGLILAAPGPFRGRAMRGFFALNSVITIPSGFTFDKTLAFTTEFWLNKNLDGSTSSAFWWDAGLQSHCPWSDGTIYFDWAGDRLTETFPSGRAGKWTHFAFVAHDASSQNAIWVNGVKLGANSPGGDSGTVTGGNVGGWPGNVYTNGSMAHFAAYKRALSDAEIIDHAA